MGIVLGIFIFCLIMGFIARGIAKKKGRSKGGWWAGGFFLPIIGVIIIACLPSREIKKVASSETKT